MTAHLRTGNNLGDPTLCSHVSERWHFGKDEYVAAATHDSIFAHARVRGRRRASNATNAPAVVSLVLVQFQGPAADRNEDSWISGWCMERVYRTHGPIRTWKVQLVREGFMRRYGLTCDALQAESFSEHQAPFGHGVAVALSTLDPCRSNDIAIRIWHDHRQFSVYSSDQESLYTPIDTRRRPLVLSSCFK